MATKPLQSTEWAVEDVANGINSTDNKAATTVPHRRFGWAFPEPPGRSHYNYWQNAVHLWKEYFNTTLDEGGLLTQNFNIVTEESNYATRTIVINIGTALGARDASQGFKQSVKTTLVISPSVTTYVAINSLTGTVSEQATLTPTGLGNSNIPLYRVTTNSTDITQVVDLRTPASTALGDIEVLDDKVVILESDIIIAQGAADTADGKAVAAQGAADIASIQAGSAQFTADGAATDAAAANAKADEALGNQALMFANDQYSLLWSGSTTSNLFPYGVGEYLIVFGKDSNNFMVPVTVPKVITDGFTNMTMGGMFNVGTYKYYAYINLTSAFGLRVYIGSLDPSNTTVAGYDLRSIYKKTAP